MQGASSAFLDNSQNHLCAVSSFQTITASIEDLTAAEKRFLLSAFSVMKYTVSIRAKHKGLIRISKFCWCVLLPAINGGCKHSCRIKGRMWTH